jgi:hypothetical protein
LRAGDDRTIVRDAIVSNAENECPYRATLIVTIPVSGTASNMAKRRVDLHCRLAKGHRGMHEDPAHGEKWEDDGHIRTTVLRHETDE